MSGPLEPSTSPWGLQPGEKLDRFLLLGRLGEGGQGEVWKAQDALPPHGLVALKLVALQGQAETGPERARREARRLAALEHPGLVRCTGLFEDLGRGLLVLVLEFVDGSAAADLFADGRFDNRHREAMLWQVARTLAYLHQAGTVHRDIKPENVLVSEAFWEAPFAPGVVKLVDLGIASEVGNPAPLTRQFATPGTPAFMAPEAIDPGTWGGGSSSPAADIFAFGVLAWRLLAGSHPAGLPPSATAIDYAIAYRTAQTSTWPSTTCHHPWSEVLRSCLALRASNRPSAAALAEALSSLPSSNKSINITIPAVPLPLAVEAPPSSKPSKPTALPTRGKTADHPPPAKKIATEIQESDAPRASSGTLAGPAVERPGPPRSSQGPRPESPPKEPRENALSLGAVGALMGLGGLVLMLLLVALWSSSSRSTGPTAETHQPAPTTTVAPPSWPSPAARPAEAGCACSAAEASADCGARRQAAPYPCGTVVPRNSRWRLRLSYVAISDPNGKVRALSETDPSATVRVCIGGTRSCSTSSLSELSPPSCGRSGGLPVRMSDLVGTGLDITVVDSSGRTVGTAKGARHDQIGVKALCQGLVFGEGSFGQGQVKRIAFFLDEP